MRILTLSQLSLAGSSGIAEAKIPLYYSDGQPKSITMSNSPVPTSAGLWFLCDGLGLDTTVKSSTEIFTLSSNMPATQKYALEVCLYANTGAVYSEIWDMTANAGVSASQLSTTSTTATLIRSGQFTLTPGHTYGVTPWIANVSNNTVYMVDASLIIFP